MITSSDIKLILSSGEGYNAEFKVAVQVGLVSAISQAQFGKRSLSRNPLIFGLFARMHMVEQIGSGIARMQDLMCEAGLSEPTYNTEGIFTVSLQRPRKTSEKTSEKIIQLLKNKPEITLEELAKQLKRSTRSIELQIQKLKTQKKIERIGPDKGGHWKVNETR